MTRINVIEPKELTREHLVAEYREITRLPGNLKQSLTRKTKAFQLTEIPSQYTLGKGHVKFFYDKMLFLQKRFEQLVTEMLRRGYKPNFTDSSIFIPENEKYYNDYSPTENAVKINLERIQERLKKMSDYNDELDYLEREKINYDKWKKEKAIKLELDKTYVQESDSWAKKHYKIIFVNDKIAVGVVVYCGIYNSTSKGCGEHELFKVDTGEKYAGSRLCYALIKELK